MTAVMQHGAAPQLFSLNWRRAEYPLHVFGASARNSALPLVLYFHGGMFHCGSVNDAEPIASALSRAAVVLCVDYPLAPQCRFPDTLEFGFEVVKWASAHARRLGADPARIVLAGDQAGGNLAAATALLVRDRQASTRKLCPLYAQVLLTPLLDPVQSSPSMRTVTDAPCRRGWTAYLPCLSDATHPYAAPVNSLRLGNLPPALIVTAEHDPLRDEAETYAAKLSAAGVPTRLIRLANSEGNLVKPEHPEFESVAGAVAEFIGLPPPGFFHTAQ